jgi:hypothetical protein
MPSTPSPATTGNQSVEVDGNEVGKKDLKDETESKGKEAVQEGRKKAKSTKAEADMNPMELSRNLEALLPRRPKLKAAIQRAGRGRSAKVPAKPDDSDEGNKNQRGKGNKGKAQSRGQGKGKQEAVESDVEVDEEKLLRQARIDYFKKLDGYEVQKEDVYIV